jgi:hypothetical protein
MNWKGRGRKRSWPNVSYYPGICLEGLRRTTGPPEYKLERKLVLKFALNSTYVLYADMNFHSMLMKGEFVDDS